MLKYSLSAADISIVTLTEKAASVSVPSKVYNLLSIGSPILCIAPQEAEIARITNKYKCGKCFSKEKVNEMIEFIKLLKREPAIKHSYSENSYQASFDFTWHNAKYYVS
jgi:hypothetical protein